MYIKSKRTNSLFRKEKIKHENKIIRNQRQTN